MATSTITKALAVLDLFESAQFEWTTEEITKELGIPHSTCYRYLKVLSDLGYLVSSSELGYTLGPKITLLAHHLRRKDPVVNACRRHADSLTNDFHGTALVNRVFRQSFICIYSAHSKYESRASFNPGEAMPLLTGANARIIQAFMSRHMQLKLFDANKDFFASTGRGETFQQFRKGLSDARRKKVWKEEGAVRADSAGIAAPILGARNHILGTFAFSIPVDKLTPEVETALVERVHRIGLMASEELQQLKERQNAR